MGLDDKILELEVEIKNTPYNKASQHHIGKLKAKLAKLKDQLVAKTAKSGGGTGFSVKKTGDATVALVGYPSVGKSTLINLLTNADSEVADYEFTTLDAVPGMMRHKELNIQLVDLPGIIEGAAEGKGRGREVLSMARVADLVVIVLDPKRTHALKRIREELYKVGLRLDLRPPRVSIKKKDRGGIHMTSTIKDNEISESAVKGVLGAYNYHNAEVVIYERMDEDRFIDAVLDNRIYIPSIVCLNKSDIIEEMPGLDCEFLPISASKNIGIDQLRDEIVEKLDFIRVFLKPQGEEADMDEPLVLKSGSNIRDLCVKLHKDFLGKFRYAQVWGENVKHQGQRKGMEHVLSDGDIISIIKER